MKKYNLSLTDNLKTIDSQENLIGLVPLNNQDNLNYSYEKIDFPYLKDSEILERYKSCRLIFNRILPELAKTLNNIHNINLSDRAWNIILGTWLMNYISIFYKIYSQMKYIKKNYNIKKIYSLDFKNFDFSVDDTLSFIMAGSKDNQWFFLLSAKLFSEFFKDVELAYNPPSEKSLKKINIDKINKNSFKSFNFFLKFRTI